MMGESASIRLVKADRASHGLTDEKCQHWWQNTIRWYARQHEVHVSVDDFIIVDVTGVVVEFDDTFYEIFVQINVTLFSDSRLPPLIFSLTVFSCLHTIDWYSKPGTLSSWKSSMSSDHANSLFPNQERTRVGDKEVAIQRVHGRKPLDNNLRTTDDFHVLDDLSPIQWRWPVDRIRRAIPSKVCLPDLLLYKFLRLSMVPSFTKIWARLYFRWHDQSQAWTYR